MIMMTKIKRDIITHRVISVHLAGVNLLNLHVGVICGASWSIGLPRQRHKQQQQLLQIDYSLKKSLLS